jgi:ABC-type branched-subunit amino acid transport system ATPase component
MLYLQVLGEEAGVSILLVERNLKVSLSLPHRAYLIGKTHV